MAQDIINPIGPTKGDTLRTLEVKILQNVSGLVKTTTVTPFPADTTHRLEFKILQAIGGLPNKSAALRRIEALILEIVKP